MCAETVLGPA